MVAQAKVEIFHVNKGQAFDLAWEDNVLDVKYDEFIDGYFVTVLRRGV